MQLVAILLIIISVLTVLSGIAVLFGSAKSEKPQGAWFLLAAICEVFWAVSIALFLTLQPDSANLAPLQIKLLYVSAMIMDTAVLGYISWHRRSGKILTLVFLVGGLVLSGLFLANPSLLYTDIIISNTGNSIVINRESWFYWAYIIYFCTLVPTFLISLYYRIKHTKAKNMKKGLTVFLVGIGLAGVLSLIFDLLLPLVNYSLIWIGPMAIGLMMILFYYAILKFKILPLSTHWMKVLSFIMLIITCVVVYVIIFFIVFTALFRIPNPSFDVLLLNLIMAIILLLLMPAIQEVKAFSQSMTSSDVDFSYIVKKINAINQKHFNLKELSQFLADNMKYHYVAFLIDGKICCSENVKFDAEDIEKIAKLKIPSNSIWQETNKAAEEVFEKCKIFKVGVLLDHNGNPFGQVILGRKLHHVVPTRKNLIEYETIINLSALVIENGGSKS